MDDKLFDLLRLVVEEYVATAEPVASATLVGRYGLDISSATIRNWFSALDAEGLLVQPHISGGRVPTEQGFKTYVERFVKAQPVSKRERDVLSKAALASDHERRVKQVAKALCEMSGLCAFVAFNRSDTFYTGLSQLFAQREFRQWEVAVSLTELLDHLDATLRELRRQRFGQPKILLGGDCPFGPACGTVAANVGGVSFGLLGPIRMDYQSALSQMITAEEILNT